MFMPWLTNAIDMLDVQVFLGLKDQAADQLVLHAD